MISCILHRSDEIYGLLGKLGPCMQRVVSSAQASRVDAAIPLGSISSTQADFARSGSSTAATECITLSTHDRLSRISGLQ